MIDFRPAREDDLEQVAALRWEAFRLPTKSPFWLDGSGFVAVDGDRVLATGRLVPAAQFFGGKSIPSMVLRSVSVNLTARETGLGTELMHWLFQRVVASGAPISTVYPSTRGFYRKFGYQIAGAYTVHRAPVASAPSVRGVDLDTWDSGAFAEVSECYRCFAAGQNGLIDRPDLWWQEHDLIPGQHQELVYGFLCRNQDQVTGYLSYSQETVPREHVTNYNLRVRDFVWRDIDAARALLTLVARNRQDGLNVVWPGAANEPLERAFPESKISAFYHEPWMIRIVDVEQALSMRGYPVSVERSVDFTVTDDLLESNNGAFRLEVSAGIGIVTRVDTARLSLDVRSLASLFTGWFTPQDLLRTGELTGATEHDVALLGEVFGGSKPWVMDAF
jgi:predicted acetyltransferase